MDARRILRAQALNRTLLLRQHLLARMRFDPPTMVEYLVGLQAQEQLPPYLGLAARLEDFDPYAVAAALGERRLVRVSTLRGTIHLHSAADAGPLRAWTLALLERQNRAARNVRAARDLPTEAFDRALADAMAAGPRPLAEISAELAKTFPGVPPTVLSGRVRNTSLVQVPPRGMWKRSGGVVYDRLEHWTGLPPVSPQVETIIRRYLAAFGPASAADVTAWSGVTSLGPVLRSMPDLTTYADQTGRTLYDVPGAPLASGVERAPVRLLGTYDNLWLSHASRDRVMSPAARAAWLGRNGGGASVVLVDGWVTALWRPVRGRVEVTRWLRPLVRGEQAELRREIARMEALLAR